MDAAPPSPKPLARDALRASALALLWVAVGSAACTLVMRLEPNLVEEGLVVHVAQRLARGEHLYRDVVFFTGPLPFELLGALFRLFGEEILVGRWATVLVQGVNAGLAFALVRRAGGGALAHAGGALLAAAPLLLFPLFSMFYYTSLAFSFGLWAVYATVRGAESTGFAFGAGLLVAAVALCKQTLGVVAAAGLLLTLVATADRAVRARRGLAMVAGGGALAVLTVAFYALRGDLSELWRCLVTLPLSLSETYSSPYLNLWPPGEIDPALLPNRVMYLPNLYFLTFGIYAQPTPRFVFFVQVLYALPLVALVLTPLMRLAGPLSRAAWANGAVLLAMTSNLFPRADWGHLVYALPPAALQLLLLFGPALGRSLPMPRSLPLRRPVPLRPLIALALVLALGWYGVQFGLWVRSESGPPNWGPRVPLRPVSAIYKIVTIPRIIRYLRTRTEPGDPIFVARSEPLLYFATDTVNPTPYEGVLTGIHDEQQDVIIDALEGEVRYVVISDLDQPMWTYYSEELPRVQAYLERHFVIAEGYPLDDASWIVILERGPDRGATHLDLFEARSTARAWILDENHERQPDERPAPRLVARHNRRSLGMRLGPWGGGIDYELTVPEGARFEAGIGYRGMVSLEDIHVHPRRSHMVIEVGRDGIFEEVARAKVSDIEKGGLSWRLMEADLSDYAGERVTLRLTIDVEQPVGRRDMSWWGSPRVFVPASSATTDERPADPDRPADAAPDR